MKRRKKEQLDFSAAKFRFVSQSRLLISFRFLSYIMQLSTLKTNENVNVVSNMVAKLIF